MQEVDTITVKSQNETTMKEDKNHVLVLSSVMVAETVMLPMSLI